MVDVLASPEMYEFTGGVPPTLAELRARYRAQAVGHSADKTQWWLNWIVTVTDVRRPVGYVQATVERWAAGLTADVAWVIAPDAQGRGLATEAAGAMIGWLRSHGVDRFVAYIHPANGASAAVARKLGLLPTDEIHDGEIRWESPS